MSKKLQCQECGKAKYGEDLYNYDGEILCRYCIVAKVYEGLTLCEYAGTCNDKAFPNKDQQINQLKQQLAKKDKEIKELTENQTQLAIQELKKVKVALKNKVCFMADETHSYLQKVISWYDICDQLNQQIKKLEGKND